MAQYISKDIVVAEIERRISSLHPKGGQGIVVTKILKDHYKDYLSFLNTLEVKEVDLDKELKSFIEHIKAWIKDNSTVEYDNGDSFNHTYDLEEITKHFFELGMAVGIKA